MGFDSYLQAALEGGSWTLRLMQCVLFALVLCATAVAGEPRDVVFKAEYDGSEQRYVIIEPERGDGPRDVLVALHGHGSDRWQFVTHERDECRAARDVAAAHGMIYVSPDYRAKTSWMNAAAEADVVQIINDLCAERTIGRVFLCGGSMGGTGALIFAVRHPDLIAGVVSMNGTANMVEFEGFQGAIAEAYGGSKIDVPDVYRERSAELHWDRLTMPVGITAGGRDKDVPAASVLRLGERLKYEGRDVLVICREDGGHATNYEDACAVLMFMIEKAASAP